jgi:hypothetical protein
MARGWESKAVESQLEEKSARDAEYARRYESSPEVRARRERAESLGLSRARTLDQLERAASPVHREMLKRTLLALERELAELT